MVLRLRNPTPMQWGVIATATALGLGTLAASLYGTAQAAGPKGPVLPPGKREPDQEGQPGSGEIIPGPDNQGPPPKKRGWGGGQYGAGQIPRDFDWNGNLVYISPDCRVIAEGRLFLPVPGYQVWGNWWMPADGGPSAQGTLADALRWISPTGETGTAWGYVARLVARMARDGGEIDEDTIRQFGSQIYAELAEMQAVMPRCPDPLNNAALKNNPNFKLWWEYLILRLGVGIYDFEEAWYNWNQYWEVQ